MLARAEGAFAELTGTKHAIGCVNGTATLHIALEALGIGAGDEVIVPALTMSATCFSVLHANATPVFADVDPETWQISAESVASLITPRTKAIMTVALYGGAPDYTALTQVAGDIPLIEDNAEAIGTVFRNKPIGTIGSFSSYSFQSSKHLSSGEGGMLCTNDDELAERARLVQTLGYGAVRNSSTRKIPKSVIQDPGYLRHESLGWNYRMPELIAAVVLAQTRRSPSLLAKRMQAARQLLDVMAAVPWLRPQREYPSVTSSYWSVGASLERTDISWKDFAAKFRECGGKGVYAAWALGYQEPAFQNLELLGREQFLTRPGNELYSPGTAPEAESLQRKILAFRTNEWSSSSRSKQITALRSTIRAFS
jgi:perosamine synthetase